MQINMESFGNSLTNAERYHDLNFYARIWKVRILLSLSGWIPLCR